MTNRTITDSDLANARRLLKLWSAKKAPLRLTQTIAAEKLGYRSQSSPRCQELCRVHSRPWRL